MERDRFRGWEKEREEKISFCELYSFLRFYGVYMEGVIGRAGTRAFIVVIVSCSFGGRILLLYFRFWVFVNVYILFFEN